MKQIISFDEFGRIFQLKIIRELLQDKDYIIMMLDVLRKEYFTTTSLRWLCEEILKYFHEYKDIPTKDTIALKIKELEESKLRQDVTNDLHTILKIERKNYKFVRDKSFDFCKRQNMKEALTECIGFLKSDVNNSMEKIRKTINEASIVGLSADLGLDYSEDIELRYLDIQKKTIPTGFRPIDEVLGGGLGVGELGIIMAPAGTGKTFVLCNIAAYNLMNGKNVVFYTLETSDKVIGLRIDAYIADVAIRDIIDKQEEVKSIIKEKVTGKLIIKEYPTKFPTINTFYSHLQLLEAKDVKPDLIIIDYADLIKGYASSGGGAESYFLVKELYEELKGMAQRLKVPLWSCTQVKVGAFDDAIISKDQAAEGSSKSHVTDVMISFSRTEKDKQAGANAARFYIAKSRTEEDGIIFPAIVDFIKGKITVMERTKGSALVMNSIRNNAREKENRAKIKELLRK